MPQQLTYPGVYVEEIPSGVRTITGVSTSITAFVGRALRGPVNEPVRVQSFGDFQRIFGGLWTKSTMSYAVQQYFMNGGSDAIIVRAYKTDGGATLDAALFGLPVTDNDPVTVGNQSGTLELVAAYPGAWGNNLRIVIDHNTSNPSDTKLFNMTIREVDPSDPTIVVGSEVYHNISVDPASSRYITKVLENQSSFLRVKPGSTMTIVRPNSHGAGLSSAPATSADDGLALVSTDYVDPVNGETNKTGIYALLKSDIFNLLCIPPMQPLSATSGPIDVPKSVWDAALRLCKDRRAMLIIDPPSGWADVGDAETNIDTAYTRDENAVVYFPNLRVPDPLRDNMIETYAPCGAVAGVMARTDATRGIWKAPAGIDATISGVQSFAIKMTDGENGILNPLGINCLRTLPAAGNVVWGARTLKGADRLASEWKYLPVRRLALYLEESLYRGTQWAVFEPNDEPLWAQLRMNVGAFMHQLYRQGAFQGRSPREAYFVKCDKETTTQNDINQGIVNVLIGFAPLKPAEFVVLKIQQIAGKIDS